MPLASSGHWTSLLGRQASHYLSQAPNISHRSIHVSAFAPRAPAQTNLSTAQRLLHQTRGLLQAFVGHLTTPGTLRGPGSGHGIHSAVRATRAPTIQQNLSFGTRLALSRPLGAPKLPRPPVVPRSVTQVGLGTARNFSSGRPIFQNLVQNVPIAGRALSEADWDIRKREEQKLQFGKAKKGEKKGKHAARAEKVHFHDAATSASENVDAEAELDHYFPASARPQVTTELLIPLAPTPSSRLPLPSNPSSSKHPLLPIPALSELHYDHTNHSLRVSTIFARLDAGKVWQSGAACDVYGGPDGAANVFRVRFEGWDANSVRGVIGESGTGWCVLQEFREGEDEGGMETDLEDVLSQLSSAEFFESPPTKPEDHASRMDFMDPAQSFVLPTLDFSSSFPTPSPLSFAASDFPSGATTPISDVDIFSRSDAWSDGSGSWIEPPSVSAARMPVSPASSVWMGFSSGFSDRLEEGPRETMF